MHVVCFKNAVIFFFLFHVPIIAMEQRCQFVPMINGIEIDNGPIVELCVAKQSHMFTDMLEAVSNEQQIIPFLLPYCNKKTAQLFSECLITHYKEKENKAEQSLESQIKSLSSKQKIRLCNVAEYAIVPSLSDKLYKELVEGSVDRKLFSLINPDVRKKIASFFIAKNKCDATLLQAYSEKLREKEYILEREGWFLKPFLKKKQICYFDNNTNTIVGVIRDGLYIKSLYISSLHPLQRWSTTWAVISKKLMESYDEKIIDLPDDHLDKIISFKMNNNETYFLCTFVDFTRKEKVFFVDIAQKTVTETDQKATAIIEEKFPSFLIPDDDAIFSLSFANNNYCYRLTPDYKLFNNVTKNEWKFKGKIWCDNEILLYNKQQIIRIEKDDYKRDLLRTTIINCVDDVMKRFVKDISLNQLPLVIYTIISSPSGRVALNKQEYTEYENIPEVCRFMIDSIYIVTKDGILSRGNGVLRSIYRTVFPYIKSVAVLTAGAIPIIFIPIFLSVLIPHISSEKFSDILQTVLKI